MRKVYRLAIVAAWSSVLLAAGFFSYVFWGTTIDERIGVFTGHALKSVQGHNEQGRTVKDIVETRYRAVRWRAYHQDHVTETYVRCEARRPDGTPITLQWFVRSVPRWRSGGHLVNTVATAINQDAADVAPSLVQQGRTIYRSPDMAY